MGNFKYLNYTTLKEPSDCVATVLMSVASRFNYVAEVRSAESKTMKLRNISRAELSILNPLVNYNLK